MAKDYAKQFYNSKAWRKCRIGYLSSVNGLCERCRARGLIVPADIVHHKVYIDEERIQDPTITLCWDNLEALCITCHNEEHFRMKRRYIIDDDGRVIPLG